MIMSDSLIELDGGRGRDSVILDLSGATDSFAFDSSESYDGSVAGGSA